MSNPRPTNKAPLADIFWSMYGEGITAVFIPPQRKAAIHAEGDSISLHRYRGPPPFRQGRLSPSTAIAVPLLPQEKAYITFLPSKGITFCCPHAQRGVSVSHLVLNCLKALNKKSPTARVGLFYSFACKPGSVFQTVINLCRVLPRGSAAQAACHPTVSFRSLGRPSHRVLLQVGFTANLCHHRSG